jgi:hypothetical protein
MAPDPVRPAYSGANVRGIVPELLAPGRSRRPRPAWMPEGAWGADSVVLLVLDGLGWEQLRERAALAPTLAGLVGGPITSVAPSTTATALTSITTGLTPGEHGIVGYRIEIAGEVVNMLRWASSHGDVRRSVEPSATQPFPPFLGDSPPVVSRADLEGTAFTEAHLRGTRPRGWRLSSGLPVIVSELVAAGERFVYAYYDGIDKVAHERGFGAFYDAELAVVDRMVGDLVERLPAGTALLVTADHGQVEVGNRIVDPDPDVLRMCRQQSGEGRFRWLHARPGAAADLLAAARERHGDVAWIHSRDELIADGWFGPVVSPPVAARYGDVALVPFEPVSFHDPADSGPYSLVCRHGSLTSAEMLVPLLCAVS